MKIDILTHLMAPPLPYLKVITIFLIKKYGIGYLTEKTVYQWCQSFLKLVINAETEVLYKRRDTEGQEYWSLTNRSGLYYQQAPLWICELCKPSSPKCN